MSIFGLLGNTTTVVGPFGTTAWHCFDHKKGTFEFVFNQTKAVQTLKKTGTTTIGVSASSLLQVGGEFYLNDLYGEAMTAEQIYKMEQLLAAKETEFTVNGVTYDLTKVDPAETIAETKEKEDGKVLGKKL